MGKSENINDAVINKVSEFHSLDSMISETGGVTEDTESRITISFQHFYFIHINLCRAPNQNLNDSLNK